MKLLGMLLLLNVNATAMAQSKELPFTSNDIKLLKIEMKTSLTINLRKLHRDFKFIEHTDQKSSWRDGLRKKLVSQKFNFSTK